MLAQKVSDESLDEIVKGTIKEYHKFKRELSELEAVDPMTADARAKEFSSAVRHAIMRTQMEDHSVSKRGRRYWQKQRSFVRAFPILENIIRNGEFDTISKQAQPDHEKSQQDECIKNYEPVETESKYCTERDYSLEESLQRAKRCKLNDFSTAIDLTTVSTSRISKDVRDKVSSPEKSTQGSKRVINGEMHTSLFSLIRANLKKAVSPGKRQHLSKSDADKIRAGLMSPKTLTLSSVGGNVKGDVSSPEKSPINLSIAKSSTPKSVGDDDADDISSPNQAMSKSIRVRIKKLPIISNNFAKTSTPKNVSKDVRNDLHMALIDEISNRGNPVNNVWDAIEAKLSKMVIDHLLTNKTREIPCFDSSEVIRECRVVKCKDQFSKNFLEKCVRKISDEWDGLKLRLILAKHIPKPPHIQIQIPFMNITNSELVNCLQLQNPSVPMDSWKIITTGELSNNTMSYFIQITESSATLLEACGYKLRFGINNVEVKVFRYPNPADNLDELNHNAVDTDDDDEVEIKQEILSS